MANWSNPTLTSLYTDFVTEVKNRDVDLALGLDPATTSPTNVPTNAIRWNSASFKYQKWDGSTWNDLSTKYIFTAVEVSGATVPTNGMYLSATNTLNFSTASTASRLIIDASGNVNIDAGTFYVDAVNNRVGIGTTGPARTLDVAGSIQLPSNNALYISGSSNYLYADASATELASATQIKLVANGALRATLDASGNLGLGVTPSAWATVSPALQISGISLAQYAGYQAFLSTNAYYNAGWKYISGSVNAGQYLIDQNSHKWFNSTNTPSANGAITFTQAMTLDASGRLLVGTTSELGNSLLTVRGNTGSATGAGVLDIGLGTTRPTAADTAIGYIRFTSTSNTSSNYHYATIYAESDGASGADNDIPGRLVFGTTADGAASPTPRMQINNLGYMQGTVNGLGAGRIPAKQYYRLDSARNGVNQAAAQSVFGVGVTLVGSTVYEFEALYWLQCSNATGSPVMSFLFGGTATLNNIMYSGVGPGSTSVLPPTSFYDAAPASFITNVATASTVSGTLTSAVSVVYLIKGTVSINAGGTFTPQYSFDVAPGNLFTTNAGSYFSIWPLAASGANTSIGSWA